MKKKLLLSFVVAIAIFTIMPFINVYATNIGRIDTGGKTTFTESGTDSETVSSSTNIEEYIEEKKTDFINALSEKQVTVDLNKSNIDPNSLFSTSKPYKYAKVNEININYQMIEGTLTIVYNITYTSYTVTKEAAGDENIIRKTTTYYHTIVDGKLTIKGDSAFTKDYKSGNADNEEEYLNGNIDEEIVANKIKEYTDDMNEIASNYRAVATITGEISNYYYDAHDEITEDMATGVITINTILNKYQVYTLTGTAEVNMTTYTLNDKKENQIIFKDYEGIVYVYNSTDILNITDEEIQAISEEMEVDVDTIKELGNSMIEAATNAVEGKGTLVGLYDFSVVDDGKFKTTATNGFKIRIKMTEKMRKYNEFYITFLKEDGTIEELIKLTQNGDYLEGILPHLSRYAVIGNIVENTSDNTKEITNNPQTLDNIMVYTSMLGICIISLTSIFIYNKKKNYNK